MRRRLAWSAAALLAGLAAIPGAANAGTVVFSDNFNSYDEALNWAPPANWVVKSGSVDLIGETPSGTSFDFYPGNGGYVDLDGSTGSPGTLATTMSFGAGTYSVSFDLGGNARGDVDKTTEIMMALGGMTKSISLASDAALTLYTYTFTTSAPGALSFSDLGGGNQNIGNILDNVTVTAVPEPATWAMMLLGFAGLVCAGHRKVKTARTAITSV